jgi:hypothetical protein
MHVSQQIVLLPIMSLMVAPAPDALTTQARKQERLRGLPPADAPAAPGRQPTPANGQHVCLPLMSASIGLSSRNPS